jgi:hypothetical protein
MADAVVTGLVLSTYAQYRQGKEEERAYEYSAKISERKAVEGEYNARTRLRKLLASQRTLYAKAGVDIASGSPLMTLASTAAEGEREALSIRYGGQETAAQQRFYGRQARRAGTIRATSTFLTGLGYAYAGSPGYAGGKKGF